MRINVHDYSGHPFQIELSRELAGRGHSVVHHYSDQYVTGHGDLSSTNGRLAVEPIHADTDFVKYDFVGRARFEIAYARAWKRVLARESFDVALVCNVPLLSLSLMQRYLRRRAMPWVLWHQDVYSLGVSEELRRRLPGVAARPMAAMAQRAEVVQLSRAAAVVPIADTFLDRYQAWHVDTSKATVIPNWAPLPPAGIPRSNEWAESVGLPSEGLRLLYAGTLGRKHNPLILLDLLDAVDGLATLVVCSEGAGADDLRAAAGSRSDVRLLGFQDAAVFPSVLASADAMVAILEPDASTFSVPSKVLSYVAAGKPTIGLMPGDNPAADTIRDSGGFVADPTQDGARAAAAWVGSTLGDPAAVERIGAQARAYAERQFDVSRIADRFEAVIDRAVAGSSSRSLTGGRPVSA